MADRKSLRTRYFELTGSDPDGRWTDKTLQNKVTDLQIKEETRNAERRAGEAKQEQARAERQARAEARGSWEEFSNRAFSRSEDLPENERKFAYVARMVRSDVALAHQTLEDFAKKLASNPAYALSWSQSSFDAAATIAVGKEVRNYVESGMTLEDLRRVATREALRGARDPERSTSTPSNLMSQCTTAAWARLLDRLGDV